MTAPATTSGPLYYADHEVTAAPSQTSKSAPVFEAPVFSSSSSSLLQRTPPLPSALTQYSVVGAADPAADSITAVIPSSSLVASPISAVVEKQSPNDDSLSAVKSSRSMLQPDNSTTTIIRNTVTDVTIADNRSATVEFKSSSEQISQSSSSSSSDNKQFHLERKPFRSSSSSSSSSEEVVASGLYPHKDRHHHHHAYSSDAAVPRPVSAADLEESLQLLRLDIHQEVQEIVREQMRQFAIAKVGCLLYVVCSCSLLVLVALSFLAVVHAVVRLFSHHEACVCVG